MSLIGFVTQNWDSIALVGGLVGGWLGLKKKQTNEDDLWDRLLDVARQKFPEILTYADAHAKARGVIEKAVWDTLNRIGVKKSRRLDLLVDEVIDKALAELAAKLIDRDLSRFIEKQEKTAQVLKAATT
jgi:hypothetical protein